MMNALFVLIVFLLQLSKDKLHIKWPLGIKTNITYIEETQEVSYNSTMHIFGRRLLPLPEIAFTSLSWLEMKLRITYKQKFKTFVKGRHSSRPASETSIILFVLLVTCHILSAHKNY